MNGHTKFFQYKSFLIIALCLVFSATVFAAGEKNHQLVAQNLSKKLQNDLANENVTVKLKKVEEYKVSKSEIGLSGDAVCVLTGENNQLPIRFDVKVKTADQSVSEVKYDFVEASYNPTANEEILTKELMTRISRDYKTENIVIAIDSVENIEAAAGEKKFLGSGEVRVGDLVWNRIKFDVVLDAETQKASKIVYKIEK
jgi:hypothetical protein